LITSGGHASATLEIGILVFPEGLECILVLAAVAAGLRRVERKHEQLVFAGAGIAVRGHTHDVVHRGAYSRRCESKDVRVGRLGRNWAACDLRPVAGNELVLPGISLGKSRRKLKGNTGSVSGRLSRLLRMNYCLRSASIQKLDDSVQS